MAKDASAATKAQIMKVLVADRRAGSRLESRENTPPQSIEPMQEAPPALSTKALPAGHNSSALFLFEPFPCSLGQERRHIPWS